MIDGFGVAITVNIISSSTGSQVPFVTFMVNVTVPALSKVSVGVSVSAPDAIVATDGLSTVHNIVPLLWFLASTPLSLLKVYVPSCKQTLSSEPALASGAGIVVISVLISSGASLGSSANTVAKFERSVQPSLSVIVIVYSPAGRPLNDDSPMGKL